MLPLANPIDPHGTKFYAASSLLQSDARHIQPRPRVPRKGVVVFFAGCGVTALTTSTPSSHDLYAFSERRAVSPATGTTTSRTSISRSSMMEGCVKGQRGLWLGLVGSFVSSGCACEVQRATFTVGRAAISMSDPTRRVTDDGDQPEGRGNRQSGIFVLQKNERWRGPRGGLPPAASDWPIFRA